MFISCEGGDGGLGPEENEGAADGVATLKEETPLKDIELAEPTAITGPTMIWCNPNAGYYETMVYESHWLDLYLKEGCNVFLFNYSGFGRSSGHPTPSALAADGDAVVEFLKKRGVTQIGIHGRSIGGICACNVAQRHPDVIKILVADRTFSSLGLVAKFTFGNWAVKGLSVAATWADNISKFNQARCYKVLICDPKDATIPDLAALRTAAAMEALNRVPPSDSFNPEDERLQKLVDAWMFFDVLFSVYDRDELEGGVHCAGCRSSGGPEVKRQARTPVLGNPSSESDMLRTTATSSSDNVEEDMQRLVASSSATTKVKDGPVNAQWLEEHEDFVRSVMGPHIDAIRVAIEAAGTQLNAGGMTLDEALGRAHAYDEPRYAMRCFLANLQVWGSTSSSLRETSPGIDREIELFLMHARRMEHSDLRPELAVRLSLIGASLTPDRIATYHRQLSRFLVAQVRRDFRSRLSAIRRALEPATRDDQMASKLFNSVLAQLREVDGFISSIYRFFKCVDLAGDDPGLAEGGFAGMHTSSSADGVASGSSSGVETPPEEGATDPPARPPRPNFDRALTGYGVWVDCGHNGIMNDSEIQHFSMHLKAAEFGNPEAAEIAKSKEGRRSRFAA